MTDRRALLAIGGLWAAALLAIRPWGAFPANDDWSWALAVQSLVVRHTWHLTDFTGMPLASQTVWGALFTLPVGFSYAALRLSTFVLGAVTLWGFYTLLRDLDATPGDAALATLILLFCPVFFALSLTFMTDVPFFAFAIWAIVFGLRYERDGRTGQLAAVVAAVTLATLQRQTGIPLAVALAASMAIARRRVLEAAVVVAVPIAALYAYNVYLDHTGAPYFYYYSRGALVAALRSGRLHGAGIATVSAADALVFLGLFGLPAAAASVVTRRWSRLSIAFALAVFAAALAVIAFKHHWTPLDANILNTRSLNLVAIGRTDLWPQVSTRVWAGLTILALASGAVCIVTAAQAIHFRWSPAMTLAAVFVLQTTPLWFGQSSFDRYYLLPLALLLALWTMASRERGGRSPMATAAAAAVLAAIALFDVVTLHDYYAFTRARWAAVDALRREGVDGRDIDGGFEVNGLLSYDPAKGIDIAHPWYWPKDHPSVTLALGEVPGYETKMRYPFATWIPHQSNEVRVLRPVVR